MDLTPYFLPNATDKNTVHSYLPAYGELLSGLLAKKQDLKILEIGIQRGGSLLGWAMACPKAKVVGIDLDDCPEFLKGFQRIITIKGDAYTPAAMEFFKKQNWEFDLIVEDGSHTPDNILWAVKNYPSLLSKDGVMVVEDVPSDEVVSAVKKVPGLISTVYDLRPIKNRFDDVLIALRRHSPVDVIRSVR